MWHKGQLLHKELSLTLTWLWIDYWNRQGGKWNYFTSKCFYPGSCNDSQTCYILLQMSHLHLSVSTNFNISIRFNTDWDIKDGLNLFHRTQMLSRILCFTHWNAWRLPESFIFISLLFPSIDAEWNLDELRLSRKHHLCVSNVGGEAQIASLALLSWSGFLLHTSPRFLLCFRSGSLLSCLFIYFVKYAFFCLFSHELFAARF